MAPPSSANAPSERTWTLMPPRVTICKVSILCRRAGTGNARDRDVNVLLFSMPDAFEHMPALTTRMPNGALTSLAANVDGHHRVAVADLILAHGRVRATVERLVREIQPDVVG